jgi:hypothetical protein
MYKTIVIYLKYEGLLANIKIKGKILKVGNLVNYET